MRRTLFLFVLFMLVSVGMTAAQEDERANSLAPGKWALMFSIGENLTLDPFTGGSVSVKRHFSDKSALRAGINFGLATTERSTSTVDRTISADRHDVGLEGLYQRYTSPGHTINFYWGAGAVGIYTEQSSESRTDSSVTRNDNSTYWAGVVGALGVEFFAARAISIHAEYRASFLYQWHESVGRITRAWAPDYESTTNSSGWNMGVGSVRFGLSAYF